MAELFHKINWIDLLIVILLFRSSYVGFSKGFGWGFFRFIGCICAVVASLYYYELVSQSICNYVGISPSFSNLIAFTTLYILILFIFRFINILLERAIKIEISSILSRVGGLLLGLLRGLIISSLLLTSLTLASSVYFEKSIKERSFMGPFTLRATPFLYEVTAKALPFLTSGRQNKMLLESTGSGKTSPPSKNSRKKGALKGD